MDRVQIEARTVKKSSNAVHLLLTGEDTSLYGLAGAALILRGLMDYRRKWWLFGPPILVPTRLGQKVRAHLQEQSNAG
jgi:hypothetical protein